MVSISERLFYKSKYAQNMDVENNMDETYEQWGCFSALLCIKLSAINFPLSFLEYLMSNWITFELTHKMSVDEAPNFYTVYIFKYIFTSNPYSST